MTIEKKFNVSEITFEKVQQGNTFSQPTSNPNVLWMKIEYDASYNAIDLADGRLAYFESFEMVIPVKAKVVVIE